MRQFLVLFFTFFVFQVHAQLETQVQWSVDSKMPANDVIYYKADQILAWDDFRGVVPERTGAVAAVTMSGFGYHASSKFSGRSGMVAIGVYCYFDKTKSWVKPGRTTEYILQHEQLHFDISYLAANIFIQELRLAELTPGNMNAEISRIYKSCTDLMDRMQDDYDRDTQNGQDVSQQKKWVTSIKRKLAEINGNQNPVP
ncbi:MAG: hypothetical protein IT254_07285 [Chitinophagaceae bacterium]|nr:hypothetical protein [Bacteroidota bacterium]MCC6258106.1 hypothetical protein [Chitinophagaceae bacterium]MCW5915989.1 hypothetical protein [Ferruginibacter sp.]